MLLLWGAGQVSRRQRTGPRSMVRRLRRAVSGAAPGRWPARAGAVRVGWTVTTPPRGTRRRVCDGVSATDELPRYRQEPRRAGLPLPADSIQTQAAAGSAVVGQFAGENKKGRNLSRPNQSIPGVRADQRPKLPSWASISRPAGRCPWNPGKCGPRFRIAFMGLTPHSQLNLSLPHGSGAARSLFSITFWTVRNAGTMEPCQTAQADAKKPTRKTRSRLVAG